MFFLDFLMAGLYLYKQYLQVVRVANDKSYILSTPRLSQILDDEK